MAEWAPEMTVHNGKGEGAKKTTKGQDDILHTTTTNQYIIRHDFLAGSFISCGLLSKLRPYNRHDSGRDDTTTEH